MSLKRPDGTNGGEDLMAAIWSGRSSDPIARNPKDVDRPEEEVQAMEVSHARHVPILKASAPLPLGQSWAPAQAAVGARSPVELLTSILRFRWTIVLVFILVSAPIIVAVWTQVVPQYMSRAEIRIRPIIPRLVFRTDENGAIPFYDSFVNTQVSLIRNPTVLQRVLDQKEVQETAWYRNPPKSLIQRLLGTPTVPAMGRLRDSLSARPRPRTEIIDVSFIDPSAKDARTTVDAVVKQYIQYIGEKSNATEDVLYRQLADQYDSLKKEIEGRETICDGLHELLGTEFPQELISSRRLRLDETQARLNELGSSIAVLEWEKSQIAAVDGNDAPAVAGSGASSEPRYHGDVEWRQLDLSVRTIKHQIDNSRYAPNHPERARLASDLEFAEELLRLREEQLDEQWRDQTRSVAGLSGISIDTNVPGNEGAVSVEYQLVRAKQEEGLLRGDLSRQQEEFKGLFESARLLEKENSVLRNKRELFDAVRQRLDQKNVERNVPGSIEILTSAILPSDPEQDRRMTFTAMALFFGLGLGGGVAFLRASRDQVIYTPRDMPQPMQAPFLGHVPLIPTRKLLGGSLSDEFERYQLSLIESVRVMRTTLLSRLNGKECTSVLISSATSGTGKSSFTIILGKSLAQAGRNVLLIDADFHKRTLSRRFDLLDSPGLIDALGCRTIEKQYVSPTETAGLSVLPAGRQASSNPVFEEMANGGFKACINQLAEQYDVILLDGPPILAVADAVIIAAQVDGTIMVEREHVSQRAEVADALVRLGATGGRLLGTVFVGSVGERDYGYKYGYHYTKARES